MKTTYRVERHWPHSPGRWAWVPEHERLTLKRAREVLANGKPFEREGMKQRIVATIQKVVVRSKSRLYSAEDMRAIRSIRGY